MFRETTTTEIETTSESIPSTSETTTPEIETTSESISSTCKSKKPSVLKLRLSEYNIYFPCAKTSILYLGVSCLETGRTVIPQINTILSQRSLLKIQKYPSTRTKVIAHKPLPIKKLEGQS
jgi:hypothetical protein